MKRIIGIFLSIISLGLVLGLNAGSAHASTDFYYGDQHTPQVFMNDSGYGCTSSTPVIGWSFSRTSNSSIYQINQGNGYITLHFKSCGNSWCVWQYGFGGGDNLYMHTCDGSANNDLFYDTTGQSVFQLANKGNGLITGYNIGQQLKTGAYVSGQSDWINYSLSMGKQKPRPG